MGDAKGVVAIVGCGLGLGGAIAVKFAAKLFQNQSKIGAIFVTDGISCFTTTTRVLPIKINSVEKIVLSKNSNDVICETITTCFG